MSRMILLKLAYDGTEFHGWQTQPGLRTVQGVIEQAIRRVVRHQVELAGSGRTDAGVHAAGQVASFPTSSTLPGEKLRHAIGSRLPKDISVASVQDVHPEFHATLSAESKLYRYRIYHSAGRPVEQTLQRYAYHIWHPLDAERMNEAAQDFVGELDFAAMAGSGCDKQTTVRTVLRCEVYRHLEEIRVDVEGRGFLYNQVRNMVGTLLNVGIGRWAVNCIPGILAGRDRSKAGPTAPARGLCLQWVRYPPHLLRPDAPAAEKPPQCETSASGSPILFQNDTGRPRGTMPS
jgi:tRNA pseudouridine38-40 synthase